MFGQPHPREPEAFQSGTNRDYALKRFMYITLFVLLIGVLSYQLDIRTRFVDGNFGEKNSLRFFILMATVVVCTGAFLLLKTSRQGELAENMIREWPVAAYTMSAAAVMMVLASFHFITDLLGALGIVYFVAAWGLLLNVILALPFLTMS